MLRDDLRAGRFQHVSWVEQTGSTNADLAKTAVADPTVAKVLFADEQTAGRGRLDRSWEMAAGGGLMVSFFVPWSDAPTGHLVPIALGVAAAESIGATGRSVGLKWPNDIVATGEDEIVANGERDIVANGERDIVANGEREIVANGETAGKKLGGMLSASVVIDGSTKGVVAGLGCNISWPPADYAELPDATSLNRLADAPVEPESLAADLIAGFDSELTGLQELGPEWLLSRYRTRCVTLGQHVRVEVAGEQIEGRATDIDPSGTLLVEVDGRQRKVAVGDVIHLRSA